MRAPLDVLVAYKRAGFDFVSLTDHYEAFYAWHVTEPPDGAPLLAIRGLELSSSTWDDLATVWVNAVGVPDDFEHPSDALDACRALIDGGAYLTVVHPALNQQMRTDLPILDLIHAVEVYTQNLTALSPEHAFGSYYADALLSQGRRILLNAADDAHFYHPRDRFAAWVDVQAVDLERDSILAALLAGRYYSSTGPRIHSLEVVGDTVTIACSPCYAIACSGDPTHSFAGQRSIASDEAIEKVLVGDKDVAISTRPSRADDEVTEVTFDLSLYRDSWCRITVIDADGRRAWTNPIWPESGRPDGEGRTR